jgi:hypothetical protein
VRNDKRREEKRKKKRKRKRMRKRRRKNRFYSHRKLCHIFRVIYFCCTVIDTKLQNKREQRSVSTINSYVCATSVIIRYCELSGYIYGNINKSKEYEICIVS